MKATGIYGKYSSLWDSLQYLFCIYLTSFQAGIEKLREAEEIWRQTSSISSYMGAFESYWLFKESSLTNTFLKSLWGKKLCIACLFAALRLNGSYAFMFAWKYSWEKTAYYGQFMMKWPHYDGSRWAWWMENVCAVFYLLRLIMHIRMLSE